MLKIQHFVFNPFGESTYVIFDTETADAVVVDPGMFQPEETRAFDEFVKAHQLKVTQIINTHLHLDHCFGDRYVRDKYGAPIAAHKADSSLGAALAAQAARFGMPLTVEGVDIDVPLSDGDKVRVGNSELEVLHVPGHSQGGIALYSPEYKFLISGDSLFQNSIGRTDLPGADHETLLNAIKTKLLTLPDETLVLPGHGNFTTIGEEKSHNPFLKN